LWRKWEACRSRIKKAEIIAVKKPGRKKGYGRSLTAGQEKKIQKLITEKCPDQLTFDFALWTREGVRLLIKKQCNIDTPIRTVGEYLKRRGVTPQKPRKYAYERDDEQVKVRLEKEYPAIKRRAKRQKAEIYWEDEATIKASDVRGRGYALKGKTPVVRRTAKKENVSMTSAITNRGKLYWKLYDGGINSQKFLEFVKRLTRNKRRKIFLIVDNAKTHRSLMLKEWLARNKNKIELYYLPAYSPDLNPDEHVNADVKCGVGAKSPKRTKDKLAAATEEHMRMLKQKPERIVSYFKDPLIRYAA
jgi:transposase